MRKKKPPGDRWATLAALTAIANFLAALLAIIRELIK